MKTFLIVLVLVFSSLQISFSQHKTIDKLEYTKDLKIVWEVDTDEMEGGIGAGLKYPEMQFNRYEMFGVTKDDHKVCVIVHGKAGKFLVNDEIYKKVTKGTDPNPNKDQVAKLISQGFSVELCAVTMQVNGWTADDLLPGVTVIEVGAYPRLIDLQYQGYKYIKF